MVQLEGSAESTMRTRALLSIGLAVGLHVAACGGAPSGGGFPLGASDGSTGDEGSTDDGGATEADVMTGADDSASGGGSGDSGVCNAPTCPACVIGNPCCSTMGTCGCTWPFGCLGL
jgi:hypothetical protein